MKTLPVDPRVEAKISGAPPFAQPILRELRELVHEACPEARETIKWGHIAFVTEHGILCMVGTFKAHCTFGFWHRGMVAVVGHDGRDADSAMGFSGGSRGVRICRTNRPCRITSGRRRRWVLRASPRWCDQRRKVKPEAKVPREAIRN